MMAGIAKGTTKRQTNKMALLDIGYLQNTMKLIFRGSRQSCQNLDINNLIREKMDLDYLGPDWRLAEIHGMASQTGYDNYRDNQGSVMMCRDCLNIVHQIPVPICVHSKELQFLGKGFPLFYAFLKNCILLLLISIASYNGISLYLAIEQNLQTICKDKVGAGIPEAHCNTFMELLSRNQYRVNTLEVVLRSVSFALHFLFLIYIRNNMIKLQAYYMERSTDLSDYAIIMKNLPLVGGIKGKIKEFFARAFKNQHSIQGLTLLFLYEDIIGLKKQKLKKIKALQKIYYKDLHEQKSKLQAQIEAINEQLKVHFATYKEKSEADELQAQRAIVIFSTEKQKVQILGEFDKMDNPTKMEYFGVQGHFLTMKTAPEPKQILWGNMAHGNPKKNILRKILGYFLTAVVLGIVTVIFFFVLRIKGLNMKNADKYFRDGREEYRAQLNGAIALVYVMLFFVIIFNKLILVEILHKFVDLQKHTTTAGYQFSYALKYSLALFFTTALMTLAVEAFALRNYNTYLYGVVGEETVMFFLNSLFVPLFWLVNPKDLIKRVKRWWYYGREDLTQRQANHLMENTPYDIGKRYAEVVEIMWFTSLYSSLIPIGACISLVGIVMYYWVDRYNLLRKSTIRYEVSGKMTDLAMKLLDLSLILKPAGHMLFDEQIREGYQISSIVMLVVGFIYQVLPMNKIIMRLNKQKFNLEQKTYHQVKFKDDYDNQHPIDKYIHQNKIQQQFVNMNLIFSHLMTERRLKSQPDVDEKEEIDERYEVDVKSAI